MRWGDGVTELKNARAFDGALLISDEGRKEIVRMLKRLDALEREKEGQTGER